MVKYPLNIASPSVPFRSAILVCFAAELEIPKPLSNLPPCLTFHWTLPLDFRASAPFYCCKGTVSRILSLTSRRASQPSGAILHGFCQVRQMPPGALLIRSFAAWPVMMPHWKASALQANQMPRYLVNQNRPAYVTAPDATRTISIRRY